MNPIFSLEKGGTIVNLKISGNFDATTTPELKKICDNIADDQRVRNVVIDFSNVKRVDSSAFACMLGFMKQHQSKLKVSVINLKTLEKSYVKILKLENWIKVEE